LVNLIAMELPSIKNESVEFLWIAHVSMDHRRVYQISGPNTKPRDDRVPSLLDIELVSFIPSVINILLATYAGIIVCNTWEKSLTPSMEI